MIPGLTLPAGSTIVNKMDGKMGSGSAPAGMPHIPGMPGMPDSEYVSVTFDHSGGWSAVSSHFDSQLGRLGYTDSMQALANLGGGAMPGSNSMRMYTKNGTKYTVMLMDMGGIMGAAGAGAPAAIPGMGAFQLMVSRSK